MGTSPYPLSYTQCPFPTIIRPFRRSLPPEQPPVVFSVGSDARKVGLRTRRKPSRRHIQPASPMQHAQQHGFNKENLVRTAMCFPGCVSSSPGPSLTPPPPLCLSRTKQRTGGRILDLVGQWNFDFSRWDYQCRGVGQRVTVHQQNRTLS